MPNLSVCNLIINANSTIDFVTLCTCSQQVFIHASAKNHDCTVVMPKYIQKRYSIFSKQSTLCPPKLILWNVINNHKVVTASDMHARSSQVLQSNYLRMLYVC